MVLYTLWAGGFPNESRVVFLDRNTSETLQDKAKTASAKSDGSDSGIAFHSIFFVPETLIEPVRFRLFLRGRSANIGKTKRKSIYIESTFWKTSKCHCGCSFLNNSMNHMGKVLDMLSKNENAPYQIYSSGIALWICRIFWRAKNF